MAPPAGVPIPAGGIFGTPSKRGRNTVHFPRKRPISILPVIPLLSLVLHLGVISVVILAVILSVILLVIDS